MARVRVCGFFNKLLSKLKGDHTNAVVSMAIKLCLFVILRLDRRIQFLSLDCPIKSGNDSPVLIAVLVTKLKGLRSGRNIRKSLTVRRDQSFYGLFGKGTINGIFHITHNFLYIGDGRKIFQR